MISVDNTSRAARLADELQVQGIHDQRVLAAIRAVPREAFVGEREAPAAYLDTALPIGCGQTISQPFIVAYMSEQLGVEPDHEVLEIGTGSGYQAAILAHLSAHVYTIERHESLLEAARERFARLGLDNITGRTGDGASGWPEPRDFDRIIVTAAASKLPEALVDQLREGGRMIVPLGGRFADQHLVRIDKTPEGLKETRLLGVRFVPLVS